MAYAQMESIEPGKRFRSHSGLLVETTGNTEYIETVGIYVHEVRIVEGVGEGNTFLHNLDYAQPADAE